MPATPTSSHRRRLLLTLMLVGASLPGTIAQAEDWHDGIVFATRGEQQLKLDLITHGEDQRRPAVLFIHGGGWRKGSRTVYHNRMRSLAKLGYVVASTDYRLTDVAPWPAQLDDVRAAYRWLIDHADQYGIDPERIAVAGSSAGGHLSQMLAFAPSEQPEFPRPRAVVNYYGPSDLREISRIEHVRQIIEPLIGGRLEEHPSRLSAISPVTHITRGAPPVLSFHGTEDELVPIRQAEILHAALDKAQVPNRLFRMEGAGHGIGGDVAAGLETLHQFLNLHLKGTDLPVAAAEDFSTADAIHKWEPTDPSAWRYVHRDGGNWLSLIKKKSDYEPAVRSPYNICLLKDVVVEGDFVLDVDLRSTEKPYGHQSLCLFFGHQDPSHFYYVHFGRQADPHANSVFLVNGAPRVSIAKTRTDGVDWSKTWHRARIKRSVQTGRIEVFLDDLRRPIMVAEDKTFTWGRVGIGSFDDTGDFDAIRLFASEVRSKTSPSD